ncbi:30S ribosomal protein S21, partial [Sulfitobacter sp. M85]|nr:30S ribosomal protein S21 [Sulfitobacter sp. Ks11]MDF3388252.1 30S ribosomal protein S21 [Sulfitobacter sp. M85]MDF3391667.1 30S ribosomal protein S21 [Sulfitobacter sp. Ks16]MDF3402305.1 30S ribosomal protein S21 [Sulfitobacter sp. KE39]MDF3405732.1 30S ribosomal protein S21 [Sulfitobacter sp. Ks35]MDF3412803.1 30S ribosomal protein S21 [Sulfitobacter sp. KE38]
NNVDQALRVLKKKLQSEDVFREMKLKQHFEEPSKKKVRQQAEGHCQLVCTRLTAAWSAPVMRSFREHNRPRDRKHRFWRDGMRRWRVDSGGVERWC